MITASLPRILLASAALGALFAVAPVPPGPARAADAVQPGQSRASQLIGQPVYGANDQDRAADRQGARLIR